MAQDGIKNVVVIGGSAGSLDVIFSIVPALPAHANAVFIIIVHRKNDGDSILSNLLSARTSLPVKEVEDKDPILANTIYIAPPDYHLLIENEHLFSLDSSEKIHYSRPSIDVTFESVAAVFGNRVIGVLLSGANADGAAGLQQIRRYQGRAIVQNPASADVGFMPQQALNAGPVDGIVSADALPAALRKLLL